MSGDSLAESYRYCRTLTRRTAHNFRFAFLTLPRDRYDAMCALYAFMRITDDIGDDETIPLEDGGGWTTWRIGRNDGIHPGSRSGAWRCQRWSMSFCASDSDVLTCSM